MPSQQLIDDGVRTSVQEFVKTERLKTSLLLIAKLLSCYKLDLHCGHLFYFFVTSADFLIFYHYANFDSRLLNSVNSPQKIRRIQSFKKMRE